jgi:Asp-tRNA(Asn)/Glu-tRNA(Gln) amidotransferase A subunit family amidase
MAGKETSGCSEAYRGTVASRDAPVVRRLLDAGAVVVGKTNMHELAFGTTNLISACGPVRNPHDPERIPGGSSGGSGAAVASRVVPIALGTDTGGSIRIPASFCGVFGLKPTHGRLSLEGVMPLASSLDCPGPMAITARDLALAWHVLADEPTDARRASRIVVLETGRCTQEIADALRATVTAFERLGAAADVVPDALADVPADVPDVWMDVAAPEFLREYGVLTDRLDRVHPVFGLFLEYGRSQTPERREAAHVEVERLATWFDQELADHDVLLMPATPYPAPRADDEDVEVRNGERINVHVGGPSLFTHTVNLVGLPSLAMPAGRTDDGLPIGVQLVGARGSEAMLLATAEALEELDARFGAGAPPTLPRS